MKPKISLVMSAARPQWWDRLIFSLRFNEVAHEIIFVGPNEPTNHLPIHAKYIKAKVKPAQCYEIGLRAAKGILVGWTADDADYNHPGLKCANALDIIWKEYLEAKNHKLILAMSTYEDGNNVSEQHRFIFGDVNTPRMAPLGFINREWLKKLGGYDRNFLCGQSENDVVMRGLADGGDVRLLKESKVYLHHGSCHGDYPFRSGYDSDREYLESCWMNGDKTISASRLKEFMPFIDYELNTINQRPAGRWETGVLV